MLSTVSRLPHEPGVYRFRDAGGRALYLGRAADLRRRVASYWAGPGDRGHLRRMMPRVERVEAVVCGSAHEAAWLERNLLRTRRPVWNRSRGEEVPVYVRLDNRARSVGLSVVHEPVDAVGRPVVGRSADRRPAAVEFYGPYLGGGRARTAVAGIERVLPVGYTADRLTGCEAELARVLGAGRAGRGSMLLAVRRVLGRDPDAVAAVRVALAARRDAAARVLAFELAERVQAELDALEWLAAEQRVAVREPACHDVAGWSAGVLVLFAVRAGHVTHWTQRRCTERAARPHLDATPPAWAGFAARNAELPATLLDG